MHRHLKTTICLLIVVLVAVLTLFACQPVEPEYKDPYPIKEGEDNENWKDHTTKDQAIDRAVGSLENLLKHLDSSVVSDTGYYIGSDVLINTDDGSAFRLHLEANLYTYPYEITDDNGNVIFGEDGLPLVDPEKLAIHNDIIRYSDIVLEWFDGAANEMLIGFYFDGINPNSADAGNDLYLNLQGSKRIFKDFGNSVMYQQLIRLITQFNLETVIGSTSSDGQASSSMNSLREALQLAITTNYKQTINGDDTTIFFDNVALTALAGTVTDFMQSIFAPFEDKLDPLTNKYLGFLFSTLGVASFRTIDADMEFIMTPNESLGTEILRQLVLDARGDSAVPVYNEQTGLTTIQSIPYQAHISAEYDVRVSSNITFDKSGYTLYDYGKYEYTGDMYIPMLDLELDVLLRTDMNEVNNKINKVFMNCRDIATDDLIIGMYYTNELTYIDIQGLQDLYGGIAFEDIGLPKAYKDGFNLAETLAWLFDFIDEYLVIAVDNILYGNRSDAEDSKYAELTSTIMNNVTSTMKDEDDPSSRATIKIKIDIEMIRKILSITSETGVEYTTEQMILLINQQFNIDLESIAAILGVSLEELIDKTYFDITYDVDEYSIRIEVFSSAEMSREDLELNGPALIMRMDLYPNHIGEYVRIVFPNFDGFKPLQDVMTYSGYLEGQFIFAATEEVDLSDMLGSFMGDMSGLNTPFILPASADIYFTLYYDQYIREQVLDNGRWTRSTRSAFNLYFYMVEGDKVTPIIRVYANDVSFNTADPVEELGYIWLDYLCLEDMPKFKVREDIFIRGFYEYMGYDFENEDEDIVMGLTDIVQALMEDSWAVFEPDVIRLTTSNQTIKDFFRVDELIGTVAIQIGFKQRVFDIDQLEVNFAMYSVGELENIEGESVYSIKLHETVEVYFDFGTRVEKRDFFFLYDPDSIAVINGETYYMPSMKNQFMGVTRDFLVHITTDIGKQGIHSLVNDYYVWEPLDPVPQTVAAYYGDENAKLRYTYNAEYRLHAVYDRNTGYYTVLNDLGYEIIYDFENNLYVLGLGSQFKYDKAIADIINTDVPYYYQTYENDAGLVLTYDLGLHKKGWYVVSNAESQILYNQDRKFYVVESEEIRAELLQKNYFGEPAEGEDPVSVYPRTFVSSNGFTFVFDLDSGKYCIEIDKGDGTAYKVLYDYDQKYFFAETYQESLALQTILGEARVASSATVSFDYDFDYEGENFDKVDWQNTIFRSFSWTDMKWEDLTLEGGKFVVYVIIGDGMMATYRENVVVKVLNRTIDTEKYVNIETPNGTVRAPVADYISIDPYVYLIYKAFYENSGMLSSAELLKGFVSWYFEKYEVTFKFTEIYGDEEDTPDEIGYFAWLFDDNSRNTAIYKEFDINNRHSGNVSKYTYVYTVFHGQVIALSVEVLPRTLESAYVLGELNHNEYTVDALEPDTYTLPTELIYYFVGQTGEKYVLNFADYNYTDGEIPSLFTTLPEAFDRYNAIFAGVNFGSLLAGPNALDIIKWSHPVANNVKLEGNTYPFQDVQTDVTTSFFDIANNFDLARNWYHRGDYDEGWFYIEEIGLKVIVPDKVIGNRDYTFKTGTDFHEVTETVMNIQVAPYYTEGQTEVGDNWGIFFVDPYDSRTWTLPREVYVLFNGVIEGTYSPYFYTVEWRNREGDNIVHFDNATGEYYLTGVSLDANYYILEAVIGAGDNTMIITVLVQNMSGVAEDIYFRMSSGELADGNLVHDGINYYDTLVVSEEARHDYQLKSYVWNVDTYARFEIPELLEIAFADGTTRTYVTDWHKHAPWVQGTTVEISTTLGDAYARNQDMFLTYSMEAKRVETITINRLLDENIPEGVTARVLTDENAIEINGVKLNAHGLIEMADGSGMTPYDFFNWLFGDLTVSFDDESKPNINITDAATSAALPIYGTLDTQKLIKEWNDEYGQGVDIYVGQDLGAHDFTIRFALIAEDENKTKFDEEQSNVVAYIELEVYNADNTPKYPNGYVIKDNLTFTVKRADGSVTVYGGVGAALPEIWSIAFPNADTEELYWSDRTERMVEVTPYEQLSVISWERLMLGGEIWVSAMLPDSSRVYARIASRSYDIGSNFHSADDDDSRYTITYGTLVIDNLYDNYRLSSFITPDNLPSKIKIGSPSSTLVKSGIVWRLTATREELDVIDHRGTSSYENGVIELARATIMGKEVTLMLKVLPTEVVAINYNNEQVAASRHFRSEEVNDLGYIVVNIDAYHNWAYNGNFTIPSQLNLVYNKDSRYVDIDGDGKNEDYENEFNYTGIFFYIEDNDAQVSEIAYDLGGHNLTGLANGNVRRDVYTYATLRDGQQIKVIFHFLDKTVETINGHKMSSYDNANDYLWLDPYSENITVPNTVEIGFAEGEPLTYSLNWEVPQDFEVKFDTAREVLNNGNSFFAFISTLEGYIGLDNQDLLLKVKVFDRVFDTYELVENIVDSYIGYENPNAYYRYTDSFSGKASDLPSYVVSAYSGGENFNLIWKFTDNLITAAGTPNGPIYVYGNIYNEDRGQPVVIKVYVDTWQYRAIRRPTARGDYIIMEGDSMRFIVSAITGVSSVDHYMVDFDVISRAPDSASETRTVSRLFIPEGINPSNVNGSYDSDYAYRLLWDQDALTRARSQGEATGYFILGNEKRETKFQLSPAIYQYENPNILQIDLGYGMGTQNNAIYVINPLNPVFENMQVSAIGTYNNEYAISYDDQGLITTVIWQTAGASISDTLLAGGVVRNWSVVLELRNPKDENFIYTQTFEIVLVALDMSPTSYINNQSSSVLTNASFKTNYNATSYAGASNPYKDLYLDYLIGASVTRDGITDNVLNTAVRDYGLEDRKLTYIVNEWDTNVYTSNNTKTQYSKRVTVGGRTYLTNFVKRVWNQSYEITGLDLGYGMGVDSYKAETSGAQKIIKVLNPLEPYFGEMYGSDPFVTKLDAASVQGTYNGADITSLGYTFSLTWWDREANGNTVIFGDEYFGGGLLDYWKVKVSVYDGGRVVYEQIVNVMLILLDMRPTGQTTFYTDSDSMLLNAHAKVTYTENTYEEASNPYGESYGIWMSALNAGAGEQITHNQYTFRVTAWGDYATFEDGTMVRNSVEVEVSVNGTVIATIETDIFKTVLNA